MFFGIALLAVCGTLYADDWPSEESVLDKARDNYNGSASGETSTTATVASPDGSVTTVTVTSEPAAADQDQPEATDADDQENFTPFVLAFVPGLQFPFGDYSSTSLGAGYIGIGLESVTGIAGAGVFTLIEKDVKGAAGAGVFTIAGGDVSGVMASGVFNISAGKVRGFQGAGVFNIAGGEETGPFQGAGVFNISRGTVNGFQGAGVFNIAEDVNGAQAAGVFNVAHDVKGIQVGLVNVANDVDGIQLGLISICRNGINNVQAYVDERGMASMGLQFGTSRFYTLILAHSLAGDVFDDFDSFGASLGFGWRAVKMGRAYIDIDLSAKSFQAENAKACQRAMADDRPHDDVDTKAEERALMQEYGFVHEDSYGYGRISAGIPLFGGVELFGGVSCDVQVAGGGMSDLYRYGQRRSVSLFGRDFDYWTRWFWGAKIEM